MTKLLKASGPSTSYTGRAGEYFVASHLLRLGYNAMPVAVDSGVDLIAHSATESGESALAFFQVKTTKRRRCSFRLTAKQLHRLWHDVINLVVVFWDDHTRPLAVVIPPTIIYMLTSGRFDDPKASIRMKKSHTTIILLRTGPMSVCIRNRKQDFSAMINRFDRVEHLGHDTASIPPYASWAGDSRLVAIE